MLGDLAQGMDEAHVQHVVGLVQDQITALFKADVALFQVVDQAAGGGDQHIGAACQRLRLFQNRSAAHNHGDFHCGAFGEDFQIVLDLDDQFTGRR